MIRWQGAEVEELLEWKRDRRGGREVWRRTCNVEEWSCVRSGDSREGEGGKTAEVEGVKAEGQRREERGSVMWKDGVVLGVVTTLHGDNMHRGRAKEGQQRWRAG